MAREQITATSNENWVCLCGNEPWKAGFDWCDRAGRSIEPTDAAGWTSLYCCNRCGRIVDHATITPSPATPGLFCIDVVGKALGW